MKKYLIIFLMLIAGTAWATNRAYFYGSTATLNIPYATFSTGIGSNASSTIEFKTKLTGNNGCVFFQKGTNFIRVNENLKIEVDLDGLVLATGATIADGDTHTVKIVADHTVPITTIYIDDVGQGAFPGATIHWEAIDAIEADYIIRPTTGAECEGFIYDFKITSGSSTILYLPLTENDDDTSGNNFPTTSTGLIYATDFAYIEQETDDGVYVSVGGTPTFVTDTRPIIGGNLNAVGQATAMTLTDVRMALRFPLETAIPENSTISNAILIGVKADTGLSTSGVKASIFVENAVNPTTWSDLSNYSARRSNAVSGSVTWNDATISEGLNNSPNISSLVQLVADQGAVSGFAVFVDPQSGCADPAIYGFTPYNGIDDAMRILLTYTTATGGGTKQQIMMMW